MNEELTRAAEEVLANADQSAEFQRRLLKLLQNVTTSNYTDADVRQVIDLTEVDVEE